jgi:ferric-dicitrate binding protein FerR (iron transport regulator)
LAKVKHPQTNGKLERWFGEYQRHRLAFSSFEEFREWYNNRPHGSLEFERLETPERAFRRKMRPEMYFAIGHRLFGLWAKIWIIHTKRIQSRCEILSGLHNCTLEKNYFNAILIKILFQSFS